MTIKKTEENGNSRKHVRSPLRAKVKITSSLSGETLVYTQDLSDGGLFVLSEGNILPKVGELVQVQVQGALADAPVLEAEVVRVNNEGIGLMFMFGAG